MFLYPKTLWLCYGPIGKPTKTTPGSFLPPGGIKNTVLPPAFPMSRNSVQGAFRKAKRRAGITKLGVAIHSLRHSYATHLLEAGVNLRLIQIYLGHTRLETTMVYLHLTQKGHEDASTRINALMQGLLP